ncbi:hypothetical protein VOLCADRAFT_121250 [Volvox carteri f. nagariensis]|uniref:Ketopantoate reductase C-terminal domain-containing protein n=1 Tax=Volvox carteri f. nagariensis TaxID=3068 RepID=D8U5W0_VOLCA|nr:uncharacterized protein VOLCADRAFT_121250 [Volvox carteri f. nagariensis]EFJ44826.1 hypothetical protein VOLCADRAFT_121250 [Volvox carteri f. nagariensis]|eukprot:XP_002954109.1 hypothetical protein VOLCADRAFT_121250 [Volvox carteri f. nagariensis]
MVCWQWQKNCSGNWAASLDSCPWLTTYTHRTATQHLQMTPLVDPRRHASNIDIITNSSGQSADHAAFLQELSGALPGLVLRPVADPGTLLRELLAKLAANCAINPLTALLGCNNGALTELAHVRGLMREVCRELIAVFGPAAFGPANGQGANKQGARMSEALKDCADAAEQAALYDWVLGVATATAGNRSSMLQDVTAGRPTEVDYLSGWVVRAAAVRNLQVPVNTTLLALVKAKEGLQGA